MNQNDRTLEIEGKTNLACINRSKCHVILYNQEQENTSNDMDFV